MDGAIQKLRDVLQFKFVKREASAVVIASHLQVAQDGKMLANRGLMSFGKARQFAHRLRPFLQMTNNLEPNWFSQAFQQHGRPKINFFHCYMVN